MDKPRITPAAAPFDAAAGGTFTTFYAYDSGPARSLVLANMAWMLAGRVPAGKPVLMIDWDLESPGLHYLFDAPGERPGLLETLEACRAALESQPGGDADPDAVACAVLAGVDWQACIERVDADRPLYLLRAGCVDASYGERVARLDWDALVRACPALMRQLRLQLGRVFAHIFIDARCGRSAAVSVCTALLPDRIVGVFTPAQRSLDGLCGVVERAIAYRCSHEDAQTPLLLYPLPCAPAGLDLEQRRAWRHGAASAPPGYQGVLETLMETSYARRHLALDSYFDQILLQHLDPLSNGIHAVPAPGGEPDRRSPGRTLATLLDWCADGAFPWQSHAELDLLRTLRATDAAQQSSPGLRGMLADFSRACPERVPAMPDRAQFPALRSLAEPGAAHRGGVERPARAGGYGAYDAGRMRQLVDAVETQLDHLQELVDQRALREARPVADRLRQLVLRPAVAHPLRRRGAALIKQVYRHDNDTDALLAFTQDELASLEQVLTEAAAGRPLAFL